MKERLIDALFVISLSLIALMMALNLSACSPTWPHRTDSTELRPYDQHVPCCQWAAREL